jgi:hypothetical protein
MFPKRGPRCREPDERRQLNSPDVPDGYDIGCVPSYELRHSYVAFFPSGPSVLAAEGEI